MFVQKLLLLNCHLLLCQGFTICDVVEFNDDFGGRVQEVSNLFVSGVIGEPVFDELADLVITLLFSLTATPTQASVSIYEVGSGLHYVRLHLPSVVLLLQLFERVSDCGPVDGPGLPACGPIHLLATGTTSFKQPEVVEYVLPLYQPVERVGPGGHCLYVLLEEACVTNDLQQGQRDDPGQLLKVVLCQGFLSQSEEDTLEEVQGGASGGLQVVMEV
jgi:hypothetical protein